jgi:hypothetical protein
MRDLESIFDNLELKMVYLKFEYFGMNMDEIKYGIGDLGILNGMDGGRMII